MDYEILGIVIAALLMVSGGIGTIYKIVNSIRKERELENEKFLGFGRDYTDQKFKELESELAHQKDLHEGKIAELSQKIDELKEEMSKHHSQLMDFLIKSIDKD